VTPPFVDEEFCLNLSFTEIFLMRLGITPVSRLSEYKPAHGPNDCRNCHGLGFVDPTGDGPIELCEVCYEYEK